MQYWMMIFFVLLPFISAWEPQTTGLVFQDKQGLPYSDSACQTLPDTDKLTSECQKNLGELVATDGWFEEMVSPQLTTTEQVSERYQLYKKVYECLDPVYEGLDQEWQSVHFLAKIFVTIVGEDNEVWMVTLASQNSPAIISLKNEAGVPSPAGYVYVRFFPSRESMPEIIRDSFYDPTIKGVTMLMRYIAILEENKSIRYERDLQTKTLPYIIDHELVHAYVNSVLGIEHQNAFPDWYNEGLAIYFSDSSRQESVVVPYGVLDYGFYKSYSTEEYQQFNDNFAYLEQTLGREELLRRIHHTFQSYNAAEVYSGLGFSSEEQFFEAAQDLKKRQDNIYMVLGIGIVLLVMLVVGNLWLWWLRKVTYRNNLPDTEAYEDFQDIEDDEFNRW